MIRLLVILSMTWTSTLMADPVERLVERLAPYRTFSSSFTQETRTPDQRVLEVRQGSLYLQGPRVFRWETAAPYAQEIVADGSDLWVYDPDLAQVTVRPLDDTLAESPIAILGSGIDAILDQYTVSRIVLDRGDRFLLEPNARDQMVSVIELTFHDDILVSLGVRDGLGQATHILFTNLASGTPPPQTFVFGLSDGVDLIDGR